MYAQEEQFQIFEQRLESLPAAAYRSALWLHDVQGMRTGGAAEALGLPVGTLKSHLHRGRQRIIKEVRKSLVPRGTSEHAPSDTALPRWHGPAVEPAREVTGPAG